jgi:hypothetical protein
MIVKYVEEIVRHVLLEVIVGGAKSFSALLTQFEITN